MTAVSSEPRADISQYSGKDTLMRLLWKDYQRTMELVTQASDEDWHRQTPCDRWQVRDLVGHLVDAAFGYLGYFKQAEKGWPIGEPLGMRGYADALGESALVFRDCGRWELLGRLDAVVETLFSYFDRLDEEQWTGKLIPHKWVGPVPAFMMATFQLMDYSVHTWDFEVALGKEPAVDEESADVLVPYMFGLMQLCFAPERAKDVDITAAVEVLPRAEQWTVTVRDGQLAFQPGAPAEADARFHFLAREFCLDTYQRQRCGEAEGDPEALETFRSLFFTI